MPGEVANIPQGSWHWEEALEDNTHLLAIFDAPYPEYIFGSDILTKTPAEVFAHTYCLDEETFKNAVAPLHGETIIIGPTDECGQEAQEQVQHYAGGNHTPNMGYSMPYYVYPQPYPRYYYCPMFR